MPTPDVDVRQRQYVSQWSTDVLGLSVVVGGVPTDVDASMTATLVKENDNTTVFSRAATHHSTGNYEVTLSAAESSEPGPYTVTWTYVLNSVAQSYDTYLTVGRANPAYDALSDDMKQIVETTWIRFADCFDSPNGGPNLQTYFQTHYDRGRIAELLRIAVGTLNTVSQPHQTYTIDGAGGSLFPIAQYGPLLERSLYVECLKHLRRSYVEQPAVIQGVSYTRLDRRDYMDRWGAILQDEEATLKGELDVFKIAMMFLGRPAVLVSGGVYGRYGPTRVAGSFAARPRYWTRWY